MKHISQNDVIQFSISVFKSIGESMDSSSEMLYVYRFCNICIIILVLTAIFANLFHAQGGMFIKTIEGSLTLIHALIKYIMFIYYKPDIKALLEDMVMFWNYRNFPLNLRQRVVRIYKYLNFGQKIYCIACVFVITMLCLIPAFNKKRLYIFLCWVPNSIIMETIVLFCQYYFLSIILYLAFPYDSIYLCYAVHVIVQLRLLNFKLKHISATDTALEVNDCIKHHQFLLTIFKRINKVYFWMFLFHYFVTLVTGCTQLYVILLGNPALIDLLATSVFIVAVLVQFAYWCFPIEEIVSELTGISSAIYLSRWYKEKAELQKTLLVMMMKAQRQKYMSAGGLMDININTFGSVIRKIFSFYAVIRNILSK